MANNRSIGKVVLELDAVETRVSFEQLPKIVNDVVKNIKPIKIELDVDDIGNSLKNISPAISSEINKAFQNKVNLFDNVDMSRFETYVNNITGSFSNIEKIVTEIKTQLSTLNDDNLEEFVTADDRAREFSSALSDVVTKLNEISDVVKTVFSFSDGMDYKGIKDVADGIKSYFDNMVSSVNNSLKNIGNISNINISNSLSKETEDVKNKTAEAAKGIKEEQVALENIKPIKESVARKESDVAKATEGVGDSAKSAASDLHDEYEELKNQDGLYAKRVTRYDSNNNPVSRNTLYLDTYGRQHTTRETYNRGTNSWGLDNYDETHSRIKEYNRYTKELEAAELNRVKIQKKPDSEGEPNLIPGVEISGETKGLAEVRIGAISPMGIVTGADLLGPGRQLVKKS